MKRILLGLLVASQAISLSAQDVKEVKAWELKGVAGLNFSQMSLSNWSGGGENSISGNAFLNGALIHKSGNWLWENNLALEYGLTNTKTLSTQKTTDKIDLSSKLGYKVNNKWYYAGLVDFKSQFAKGYNYPNKDNYISKFLAPGYSNISVGMEYRPNDNYSVYFSPVAGKLTFVSDTYLSDLGAFGVDPGDKFKAEFGTYLKAKAQKDLMENVKLITKVDFFTAYDKSFGNVDIDWDLLINMKINKFLNASINTTLRYDDDVKYINKEGVKKGPKVQFKEVLGIGLAYSF